MKLDFIAIFQGVRTEIKVGELKMSVMCYITGNSLKENEVALLNNGTIVEINNSQDALKYRLPYVDWHHFSVSKKQLNSTTHLFTKNEVRRIRAFVFNKNKKGNTPNINNIKDDLTKNKIFDIPTVYDRAILLLEYLVKNTKELGKHITLNSKMISLSYSLNANEALYLIKEYLEKIGYISEYGQNNFIVTPKGFEKIEELKKINKDSKKVFIIMPFDKKLGDLHRSIEIAVKNCGYQPDRIDKNLNNKKIDDDIIVRINKSRFVICDLTPPEGGNQNGNVYFEAGYALGRKIEIIWTCEKKSIEKLPFDIRQYKCIDWQKDILSEFEKKLQNTILSVIDDISG